MTQTTINPDELAKFAAMADEWWDPTGKFKPLHKFNPVRLGYVRDQAIRHFDRDAGTIRPLEGLKILDIGCGGGLLSEPLTRLGATVTGIDPGEENIAIASLHAERAGLEIDYRAITAETLAETGAQFDIVLNMEVVEHVDNVPLYMQTCATLVAPGGLMVTASINRTLRARALAVFAAENVLRWLPRGTHDYAKFLTPDEIAALCRRNGLKVIEKTGVAFHPLADEWRPSRDTGINYMVLAEKPAAA
ncbi:bifunctional 2-polyprenyl-6-hydroxyphenol methylase/3-demethylubiquinol 3-O-methyltransferase UbiG [Devosia sp.]|uniref:bifunctional 2-polyprenyl-6-hydroxyphenol methylase/3-demethylubiquinol 3-O-methyltransferase UbiG n=1 Tax=Devosia sp. TaxID=1871048 RepID=UPI003A9313C5